MPDDSTRPLTHHLEELRWRIIVSLVWTFVSASIAYFYFDPILTWLAKPVGEFVFTTPTEAFFIRLKISLGVGIVCSFPFYLYQLWRFVEVALKWKERSLLVTVVPAASLLFIFGMALSLFGVAPIAVKFLLNFSSPHLRPMISLDAYISFLLWMMIGFGVFFQMPLVIVVLTKAGVLNPHELGLYRKHVLVGILVMAALLTPGPDIFSQLALSLPSYVLFEISLLIARRIYDPRV